MKQHKRFHFTYITLHLALIPDWNPYNTHANDRKDDQPLNHFSSHKSKKPQKPCFRWLAAFIPSWMQSGRSKLVWGGTSLGKVLHSSTRQPNQWLAMVSAWCYWPDQKLGYREALWNFYAVILSVTHRFFFFCVCVSLSGSRVSCFYSWRSGNK